MTHFAQLEKPQIFWRYVSEPAFRSWTCISIGQCAWKQIEHTQVYESVVSHFRGSFVKRRTRATAHAILSRERLEFRDSRIEHLDSSCVYL